METQAITFDRASAMPAPTWHFMKSNEARIEIPAGLEIAPDVSASVPPLARGAADEFENALANAQLAWDEEHPMPTEAELAERAAFLAAEADATYGGTAQSDYQANADAIEEARSLAMAFETGVGDEVGAYLRYAAGDRIVVAAGPGEAIEASVCVRAVTGAISAAAIDVVAGEGSTVRLKLHVDSPEETPADKPNGAPAGELAGAPADSADAAHAIAGTTLRVFADAGSTVDIVRSQTLDDGVIDIDDMGLFTHKRANVSVCQTVLGAGTSFAGLAADLRGAESGLVVDTRYLGHGSQKRDFNYIVRHHGQKTECNLKANGVLAGASEKTLKATIDLIRGAKGAQGSERENVLLVDEGVRNKTVPVILCNEDDVAGNHGATIGHIRSEQLFYLASRGLAQDAAERMFVSAIVEQAAIDAPGEEARRGIVRLGERIAPGFAELFDDGDAGVRTSALESEEDR